MDKRSDDWLQFAKDLYIDQHNLWVDVILVSLCCEAKAFQVTSAAAAVTVGLHEGDWLVKYLGGSQFASWDKDDFAKKFVRLGAATHR